MGGLKCIHLETCSLNWEGKSWARSPLASSSIPTGNEADRTSSGVSYFVSFRENKVRNELTQGWLGQTQLSSDSGEELGRLAVVAVATPEEADPEGTVVGK